MACTKVGLIVQFGIGIVILIASIVLVVLWPSIYDGVLKNQLVLSNTSQSYPIWKDTPIPMYLDLYLFDLTNAKEVMKDPDNVKPHFEERGPYVFKEYHLKVGEQWHDNGTITFMQRRTWHFEEKMSNGSLDDNITNVNVVATTMAYFVRNKSPLVKLGIETLLALYAKSPITTKTARELLFDGYSDKLMEVLHLLPIEGFAIPEKFGWFYARNETDNYDGILSMFTGATDINKLGEMDLWNYNNKVDFYDGECGAVNGGTGELFPPKTDPDYVKVFATDVCSTVTLKKTNTTIMDGLTGTVFTGDDSVFDNGWNHPEESCFCPESVDCQPAGTRNVSQCRQGAPAFVSFPHFYLSDPSYLSRIDGIKEPNKEDDEFKMILQLDTGIPLLARANLQISILVQRIPEIPFFDSLPDKVYMPTLWFRQRITITEEFISMAKFAINIPNIVNIVLYVLLAVGALLILIGIFILFKYPLRRSESREILTE